MAQRQRRTRLLAAAGAAAIALVVVLVLVLGGSESGSGGAGGGGSDGGGGERRPGGTERVSLLLDYFPNADHAGIYAAQAGGRFRDAGLDVRVRTPSDPSTPLKLLAAGNVDFAVSYEPEVLRARDKGAPVVAVAALVQTPLTALISLPEAGIRTPADLRGKTVGTAGIDYQGAYLKTILAKAGVPPGAVEGRNVGFDLAPALISGKVDAVLGAFWNYEGTQLRLEGKNPQIIRMENAGVPPYDELVIAVHERDLKDHPERIRAFVAALGAGTADLRANPDKGTDALLKANPDLDPKLQRAVVKTTLPHFLPPPGKPYGYMDPGEWLSFTGFMNANRVLSLNTPEAAFTNEFLPEPAD